MFVSVFAVLAWPRVYRVTANGDKWAQFPLLKRIAACESTGDVKGVPRQFLPNGEVLRGYPNPHDIGEFQINEPTWGKVAKQLGFDIYTEKGNFAMGKWIYVNDRQHEENWKWSEHCWRVVDGKKYDIIISG